MVMTMMRRMAILYSMPRACDWAHTRGAAVSYRNYLEASLPSATPFTCRGLYPEEKREARQEKLTDHTQQTPVRPEEIRDERGREERARERHWRGRQAHGSLAPRCCC